MLVFERLADNRLDGLSPPKPQILAHHTRGQFSPIPPCVMKLGSQKAAAILRLVHTVYVFVETLINHFN